ncbi:MAG: hypothetical protein HGB14_08155, partial [Anaerolineaceae bacterium]|nr:hypothetical protein [Anaerolineaceae bacterium]
LLTLVPGVTTGRLAGNNTASQSTTNNFRVNGGRGGTSEILIDGAANTGTYNNQVSAIPQIDSVQEFKIQPDSNLAFQLAVEFSKGIHLNKEAPLNYSVVSASNTQQKGIEGMVPDRSVAGGGKNG